MLNFNDNKDISTIETQIIKNEKQINSALLELFNNQYKAPKSLKGDKDFIDFNDLEKEINNSLNIKKSLIISQKTRKKTGIHLNKNNILFNQNIILYNKNINLNRSINSSNEEENNISAIDKPEKKLILQKRFDKGNIALNSNQITNVKDINNPYIYSYVDWHPYSFCTGHRKWGYENGKLKSPSPTFISNDEWCEPKDLSKSEVLKGILIKDDVGLLLVDPLVCNKFSGMLGDLIKQILKVFFGHKISLNVKLFQPLSLSQTLLNYFSFILNSLRSNETRDFIGN